MTPNYETERNSLRLILLRWQAGEWNERQVHEEAERIWALNSPWPGIFAWREREPEQSINFVACHDGFTLNDVVSYNDKHNDENGESNRDGSAYNRSWNCGFEGPTDNEVIERLRNRQVKNFLTVVMLSGGVPMFLMGDEVRRSQRGNNNAYCQDNDTSWFDWNLLSRHADVLRFVT